MGELRHRLRGYRDLAIEMEPLLEAKLPRAKRESRRLVSVGVFMSLDLADWLIRRFTEPGPAIWPSSQWPWADRLGDMTPAIREELDRYLTGPKLPHTAETAGFEPDSAEANASVPIGVGAWRALMLFVNGHWIEETARHFPTVVAAFDDVHPKASVAFSLLEPRSHIEPHVGANRGAVRLQVPIIVPGELGDCRIRIADEVVKWREGEPVFFDLAVDHEAWNDTDADRVLLMVELLLPLPQPIATFNRILQYPFRWHPSYRQMPERIRKYGRERDLVTSP